MKGASLLSDYGVPKILEFYNIIKSIRKIIISKVNFLILKTKQKNHGLFFLPNRRRVQKLRHELSYFRLASRSEFRSL